MYNETSLHLILFTMNLIHLIGVALIYILRQTYEHFGKELCLQSLKVTLV